MFFQHFSQRTPGDPPGLPGTVSALTQRPSSTTLVHFRHTLVFFKLPPFRRELPDDEDEELLPIELELAPEGVVRLLVGSLTGLVDSGGEWGTCTVLLLWVRPCGPPSTSWCSLSRSPLLAEDATVPDRSLVLAGSSTLTFPRSLSSFSIAIDVPYMVSRSFKLVLEYALSLPLLALLSVR